MQRMMRRLLPLLFLAASPLLAQAPHLEWRTITTESFRVHYPEPWEEWTLRAASRLESARDRVAAAVGYDPEDRIEVLVMDPAAAANGMALPLLGRPRIILWATPPEALSAIGDSRDWQEQLIVHETAHILHLNRPSRDPLDRLLARLLPIGPVARAPRWVSEGYATVIEGELTGSGRPFRDFRAAVLREWAIAGRLPSYGQLAGDSRSFMGMSMAYLAGSAYLEWLRDRTSPDALTNLWRRMSAREDRSFEEAFAGVFGDSPDALYALFRAELTQKARNLADEMEPVLREGELFLDLTRRTGPIDVSSDGSRLVGVLRPRDEPVRLVIWNTAIDTEAVEKRKTRLEEVLERDPEDVLPIDPPALPHERLHSLTLPRGADVESVAFAGEPNLVLFTSNHPDDDGVLHSELHVWNPEDDLVRRVTSGGDVFSISPDPAATSVTAVRNRFGKSAIVRIELASGRIDVLVEPRLAPLITDVASGEDRLAWVERDGGRWSVVLADANGARLRTIDAPAGAMIGDLSWAGEELVAALGLGGFIEVAFLDPDSGEWSDTTRSTGAAFSPVATPGHIYFLDMTPEGLDVRRIERTLDMTDPSTRITDARFAPAVRVTFAGDTPPPLEERPIDDIEPYGFGPREIDTLFGGYSGTHTRLIEGGLRWGDPIGRFETLLLGGWSSDDERGLLLDAKWRGTPSPLRASVWNWRRSEHDAEQTGAAVGIEETWRARSRTFSLGATAGWETSDLDGEEQSGAAALVEGSAGTRHAFGSFTLDLGAGAAYSRRETDDQDRVRGTLALTGSLGRSRLGYVDSLGHGSRTGAFRVGGLASSILPPFERVVMVEVPALAPGRLAGEEFRNQRASLSIPLIPGELFAQRLTAQDSQSKERVELLGWNVRFTTAPLPIVGFPALELDLGGAWEIDASHEDDVTWWIGTRWSLE